MPNIEEVLLARGSPLTCYSFHTLMNAVGKSYVLQGQHPITVFVPSDVAFEALHQKTVYDLLKDISKLEELLNFHLVPMKLTTSDVTRLASQLVDQEPAGLSDTNRAMAPAQPKTLQVETFSGYPLTVTLLESTFQVNSVKVYEADILADNGVVHILERILWPPGLNEDSFRPVVQHQHISSTTETRSRRAEHVPTPDTSPSHRQQSNLYEKEQHSTGRLPSQYNKQSNLYDPRGKSYTPSRHDPDYAPQIDAYALAQRKQDNPVAPLFDDWLEQRELTGREPNRQNQEETDK
jgi:uncharacterized surface protein with fasciclin (FAS1) repeats